MSCWLINEQSQSLSSVWRAAWGRGPYSAVFPRPTEAKLGVCMYRSSECMEEWIYSFGLPVRGWEKSQSFLLMGAVVRPPAKAESLGTVFALKSGESQTGKSNSRLGWSVLSAKQIPFICSADFMSPNFFFPFFFSAQRNKRGNKGEQRRLVPGAVVLARDWPAPVARLMSDLFFFFLRFLWGLIG